MTEAPDPPLRIGRRIRRLREDKNLTQEHMADQLGMSVSGYSRIERDEVKVDSDKLVRICSVLGKSLIDLLTFDEGLVLHQNQGTFHGCGFAHSSVINDIEHLERLYREQIDLLKKEAEFHREEIKSLREEARLLREELRKR